MKRTIAALCLLNAALAVVLGFCLAGSLVLSERSLFRNGNWSPTKIGLAKPVMGAWSFYYRGQALEGDKLHLDAWFGHQEVLYKEPVTPQSVSFRMELSQSDLYVLFACRDATWFGLKLTTTPGERSFFFTADAQKAFREIQPLPESAVKNDAKTDVLIVFTGNAMHLALGGVPVLARGGLDPSAIVGLGFKGASRHGTITDVRIKLADGKTIVENFDFQAAKAAYFGSILAVVLLAEGALCLFFRKKTNNLERVLQYGLCANATLAAAGLCLLLFMQFYVRQYPVSSLERQQEEAGWRTSREENILAGLPAQARRAREEGKGVILFVGASQIEGSGAARAEDTVPAVAQRLLDAGGSAYACLGGGISGIDSGHAVKLWDEHLAALRPDLVIVDLCSNDARRNTLESYAANMQALVSRIRQSQAAVLLILEPNFPLDDTTELQKRHAALREIAAAGRIPVLDMHDFFTRQKDAGILWWDFVHLTSLGQKLFAQQLYERLVETGLVRQRPGGSG